MSGVDVKTQADAIERAGDWYAKNRAGNLSPQEADAFLQWLQASPLNVREYLAAATLADNLPEALAELEIDRVEMLSRAQEWIQARSNVVELRSSQSVLQNDQMSARSVDSDLSASAAASAPVSTAPSAEATSSSAGRWRRAALSIAASLVLIVSAAVGIGLYAGLDKPGVVGWTRGIDSLDGQRRTVRLRDGSVVHLDAGTVATVSYTGQRRLIELDYGRAMFSVAHDKARPFVVRAGAAEVVAVGTRFDVQRDRSQDAVVVTVVEGKVDVVGRGVSGGGPQIEAPKQPLHLKAGQQVQLAPIRLESKVETVNARQATSWLRHELVFTGQPLGEVAAQFSRYGLPIRIDDPELRNYRVNGVFDAYDTESFIIFLERLGAVERDSDGVRVGAR